MRRILPALSLATLLTVAPAAQAQDNRVGLGLGIATAGVTDGLDFGTAAIYVPIDFGSFRLEPEVGFVRFDREAGPVEQSNTVFHLGTGIFAMRPHGNTALYYGGRIGFARQSEETELPGGDEEESSTNLFLGPAVGAEYAFSERFSLGGEAQIIFTALGEEDDGEDVESSLIRTRTVFFVRWYF
ncbi:MAG TPA: outer membrane beta-barrel protein [Rhodothermales bacterium]